MSPQEKAEHAASALSNPAFLEAMDAVKAEVYRLFTESTPAESQAREHYWRLNEAVLMVERCLKGYLESGKLEVLEQQLSPVERVKRGLTRFIS